MKKVTPKLLSELLVVKLLLLDFSKLALKQGKVAPAKNFERHAIAVDTAVDILKEKANEEST